MAQCLICDKEFTPPDVIRDILTLDHCSEECIIAHIEKDIHECLRCKRQFKSETKTDFCSEECKKIHNGEQAPKRDDIVIYDDLLKEFNKRYLIEYTLASTFHSIKRNNEIRQLNFSKGIVTIKSIENEWTVLSTHSCSEDTIVDYIAKAISSCYDASDDEVLNSLTQDRRFILVKDDFINTRRRWIVEPHNPFFL